MGLIGFLMFQLGPEEGPGLLSYFQGPMARAILAILVFFSLGSWAVMIGKLVQLRRADQQSEKFLEAFHRSQRFSEVNAQAGKLRASPLVGIFQAGYAEIDSQIKAQSPEGDRKVYRITSIPALQRTLGRAASVELQNLARWITFLATTAAATPFIGLFGTVWGIMTSFQAIAASKNTNLAVVAPGIAEALLATALGLLAAIPAVVFYNKFSAQVSRLATRMEGFSDEFAAILSRQIDERNAA
jgi:biopolymer transport protein TolQ